MTDPPGIMCAPLCPHCTWALIWALGLTEADPWQAFHVTGQLLLFQRVTAEPDVWRRAKDDPANMTQVLAEYGCPSCAFPGLRSKVLVVLLKGLHHAAQVAQGKLHDPDHIDLRQKRADGQG